MERDEGQRECVRERDRERHGRSKLTWNTVTVAHKKLLKCLRSHSQSGCLLMISGQVHSLSPNSSSIYLQNLPPNRYIPRMLQFLTMRIYIIYGIYIYGLFFLFVNFLFFCGLNKQNDGTYEVQGMELKGGHSSDFTKMNN